MALQAQPPDGPAAPILAFATQGSAHLDALRLRELLAPLGARELDFDRAHKLRAARGPCGVRPGASGPRLIVMEGTGTAGGVARLGAAGAAGASPTSSPAATRSAPIWRSARAWPGSPGASTSAPPRCCCAGFIGWSPLSGGTRPDVSVPRVR